MGLLLLLFLIVPVVELAIVVRVSSYMGLGDTIGLLIVISIVGAWLVKHQGLAAWIRLNAQLAKGSVPGKELIDGVMILVAGAFLLTPGFLTDAIGLSLLMPPVRAALRRVASKSLKNRVVVGAGPLGPTVGGWMSTGGRPGTGEKRNRRRRPGDDPPIIDVDPPEPR